MTTSRRHSPASSVSTSVSSSSLTLSIDSSHPSYIRHPKLNKKSSSPRLNQFFQTFSSDASSILPSTFLTSRSFRSQIRSCSVQKFKKNGGKWLFGALVETDTSTHTVWRKWDDFMTFSDRLNVIFPVTQPLPLPSNDEVHRPNSTSGLSDNFHHHVPRLQRRVTLFITQKTLCERREELDSFVKELCDLPLSVRNCNLVSDFFSNSKEDDIINSMEQHSNLLHRQHGDTRAYRECSASTPSDLAIYEEDEVDLENDPFARFPVSPTRSLFRKKSSLQVRRPMTTGSTDTYQGEANFSTPKYQPRMEHSIKSTMNKMSPEPGEIDNTIRPSSRNRANTHVIPRPATTSQVGVLRMTMEDAQEGRLKKENLIPLNLRNIRSLQEILPPPTCPLPSIPTMKSSVNKSPVRLPHNSHFFLDKDKEAIRSGAVSPVSQPKYRAPYEVTHTRSRSRSGTVESVSRHSPSHSTASLASTRSSRSASGSTTDFSMPTTPPTPYSVDSHSQPMNSKFDLPFLGSRELLRDSEEMEKYRNTISLNPRPIFGGTRGRSYSGTATSPKQATLETICSLPEEIIPDLPHSPTSSTKIEPIPAIYLKVLYKEECNVMIKVPKTIHLAKLRRKIETKIQEASGSPLQQWTLAYPTPKLQPSSPRSSDNSSPTSTLLRDFQPINSESELRQLVTTWTARGTVKVLV